MRCAECRFSEGEAVEHAGRWVLRLWCAAKGGRALEPCENFAPIGGEDGRGADGGE